MESLTHRNIEHLVILVVLIVVYRYNSSLYNRRQVRTSILTGAAYTQEVMIGHPRRFQEVMRMPRYTFGRLVRFLEERTDLQSSRNISIEEKLAMFMHAVGHGQGNQSVQERYQHSGETVSRCFHEVLNALMIVHLHYIQQPDKDERLADKIKNNPKFTPFFDDCLGALDGTHIFAHVPPAESAPYRNRKGTVTQNVLAVCNFDLKFTYLLPGWEGSTHDSRVLLDAVNTKGFTVPKGKYFLADAGYTNSDWLLIPYKGEFIGIFILINY